MVMGQFLAHCMVCGRSYISGDCIKNLCNRCEMEKLTGIKQKDLDVLDMIKIESTLEQCRPKTKYRGISYPTILDRPWIHRLWKKHVCSKDVHLFDEVWSMTEHCLYCDACGLSVHIARFEEEK